VGAACSERRGAIDVQLVVSHRRRAAKFTCALSACSGSKSIRRGRCPPWRLAAELQPGPEPISRAGLRPACGPLDQASVPGPGRVREISHLCKSSNAVGSMRVSR
jgi:hypothetical protein